MKLRRVSVLAAGAGLLVRKYDLGRAGGSARRRASADGLWVTVSGGSGGGGLELAGVGVDGLDGDLVAEAFAAFDVVAGLAAGEHGVPGRDQGFLLGHAPGHPPVPGAEEGVGAAGSDRGFAEGGGQAGVAA